MMILTNAISGLLRAKYFYNASTEWHDMDFDDFDVNEKCYFFRTKIVIIIRSRKSIPVNFHLFSIRSYFVSRSH